MSKYIIIGKLRQEDGLGHYYILFHTHIKCESNVPYLDSNLTRENAEYYAISKENVPHFLRIAQNIKTSGRRVSYSKLFNLFVIKLNSPKLQQFIQYNKTKAKFN